SVKLKHLDDWTASRRKHARTYHELLGDVKDIQLPGLDADAEAQAWHLFVILLDADIRDRMQKALGERGVGAGIHYPTPVPLQPAYAHLGHKPGDFPVAEDVMRRCLSLPMFAELTPDQLKWTADSIRQCLEVCKTAC